MWEREGFRAELRAAFAISIKIWKVELSYPLSVLWFIVMPFMWFIPMMLTGTSISGGANSSVMFSFPVFSIEYYLTVINYPVYSVIRNGGLLEFHEGVSKVRDGVTRNYHGIVGSPPVNVPYLGCGQVPVVSPSELVEDVLGQGHGRSYAGHFI